MIERDDRTPGQIGKQARLDLTFALRDGRTRLVREYAEPPFRVGRAFADDAGGAHLIVASSAPGIFGGDELQQSVHVEAGATVRLTSQSALQIHSSLDRRPAQIRSRYLVESGGSLVCEWDPNIPFPDARVDQRTTIDLAAGTRLFWSDGLMSGREARGERWQFASLAHELRVQREGVLVYLERYQIDDDTVPSSPCLVDDSCYFGTVLIVDSHISSEHAAGIHAELSNVEGVRAAADVLEPGLMLIRLMASAGVPFHRARTIAAERLKP